jgi:hypothetical protein
MNEGNDTRFVLAESVRRDSFEDDIYAHLGALAAVEFSRTDSPAQSGAFQFNAAKYQALEQAAFEEAPRMEAQPPERVNWSYIDEQVSAFEKWLTASLSDARRDGDSSPFIEFSTKCYENWLTYDGMYPNSNGSNPWARTMRILRFGRLLVIDDKSSDAPASDSSNVAVSIKAAPQRPVTMPVDERFSVQARLLSILRENARGHANKIPLSEISKMLASVGIRMTIPMIQIRLTTPLKKAGVIGSTGKGFFFIESEADLIESYCFHLTKVKSADKIMRRYEVRARAMNPELGLAKECKGTVLNPGFGTHPLDKLKPL